MISLQSTLANRGVRRFTADCCGVCVESCIDAARASTAEAAAACGLASAGGSASLPSCAFCGRESEQTGLRTDRASPVFAGHDTLHLVCVSSLHAKGKLQGRCVRGTRSWIQATWSLPERECYNNQPVAVL